MVQDGTGAGSPIYISGIRTKEGEGLGYGLPHIDEALGSIPSTHTPKMEEIKKEEAKTRCHVALLLIFYWPEFGCIAMATGGSWEI